MKPDEARARTGACIGETGGWGTLAVLVLLSAISYMDRQILSLMIDPIRRHFGISDVQVSLLHGTAFALFYVIAALPIGWAVDRFQRRRIIHAGVTVWSLAAAACGIVTSFPMLLLSRALVGAGEGTLAPAAYSMLADRFAKERLALALGLFAAGSSMGSGIALIGGGWLIDAATRHGGVMLPFVGHLEPWQFAFVATGAPGILLALLIFLVPEPSRRDRAPAGASTGRSSLFPFLRTHARLLLCHFGGFSLIAMMVYGCATWAPAYLTRTFDVPIATIGLGLGLSGMIGGTVGFVGGGWIVDRWFGAGRTDAHFRYHVLTVPVSALLLLAAFNAPGPKTFMVLFAVATMLVPYSGIAAAALQISTPNRLRGRMSAMFVFCTNLLGVGLGPVLVAALTDHVFGGSEHVREGVLAMIVLLAPPAWLAMYLGLRPFRAAIARQGSLVAS